MATSPTASRPTALGPTAIPTASPTSTCAIRASARAPTANPAPPVSDDPIQLEMRRRLRAHLWGILAIVGFIVAGGLIAGLLKATLSPHGPASGPLAVAIGLSAGGGLVAGVGYGWWSA